jgi:integrase/recombinase XerD
LVTIAEVQAFVTQLRHHDICASAQRNIIAAVKSLLSFGNKIGVLPLNAGAPVSSPKVKDTLNQRIISELEIQTMIALEVVLQKQEQQVVG